MPTAKNGPSVLSTAHPHHQRVLALLRATAAQLPDGFLPFREALALTLTLRTPADAPRGDPTNFLGGVADVLQRKPDVESIGDLSSVLVYENDLQLRRIDFRQETSAEASYEISLTSLGGPDLVERRVGPLHGLHLEVELFEVDEVALSLVNAFERPRPRDVKIKEAAALLAWLQAQRVVSEDVLRDVRRDLGGSETDAAEFFARTRRMSAALTRLFLGERRAEDARLITELRRISAKYETVDLDGPVDLPLANLELDATEPVSLLAPIIRSALRLLLPSVRGRIRECADVTCRRLFLDRSKNGTKTWCDMATCGSRAKQRTWRQRHAGLQESAVPYFVA